MRYGNGGGLCFAVSLPGIFEPSVLECQLVLAAPEVATLVKHAFDNAVFTDLHVVKLLVGRGRML
jgi:hypothetical protein